jgi:hypothetical protein
MGVPMKTKIQCTLFNRSRLLQPTLLSAMTLLVCSSLIMSCHSNTDLATNTQPSREPAAATDQAATAPAPAVDANAPASTTTTATTAAPAANPSDAHVAVPATEQTGVKNTTSATQTAEVAAPVKKGHGRHHKVRHTASHVHHPKHHRHAHHRVHKTNRSTASNTAVNSRRSVPPRDTPMSDDSASPLARDRFRDEMRERIETLKREIVTLPNPAPITDAETHKELKIDKIRVAEHRLENQLQTMDQVPPAGWEPYKSNLRAEISNLETDYSSINQARR